MMNNLQSSAFVAKTTQLLSSVARFRLLLVMLLTLTVSANAWGEEVTFNPSTDKGSVTANGTTSTGDEVTKSGFTITSSNGVMGNGSNYRVYKDGTLSITSTVGNITAISFTFSSNNYTGGFNSSYTGLSTTSWSASATSQARITKIAIIYTPTSTTKHTVTLVPGSGSVTDTELTEASAGAGVTLPTPTLNGCDDWSFAGWKTTSAVTTETTTEPTLIPAGTYKPTEDITLYAVYQRTEETEGGGSTTHAFGWENADDESKWTIFNFSAKGVYSSYTSAGSYAASTNSKTTGYIQYTEKLSPTDISCKYTKATSNTNSSSKFIIQTSTDGLSWTDAATGSTMNNVTQGTFKTLSWTGSLSDVYVRIYYTGTNAVRVLDEVSITATGGGGLTTYYHSNPDCITQTAVTLHPNGGDGEETTATIEGTTYTVPDCSFSRLGYTFANWNTIADGTGTSYDTGATIDLDGTDVNLYAQWTCKTPVFDIKIKEDNPVVFSGESIELTIVGSNIATDATYQWYKYNGTTYDELPGQKANKLTIAEATANDAGNYKCVVTNGTCPGENNYTVKMYHIKGLTDGTWTTPFEFEKTGDKEGTFFVELAANTTYYFKLNDGSVWYWNEGTMTHNNCTDWVIEQEGADTQGKANTGITTTASGTYIFTLNYEDPSKPKLSVTYPAKRIVYLEPNIWASDNPKFAVHAWGGAADEDVLMTKIDDCADRNIYFAEIDAAHTHVIFIRGDKNNYSTSNPWNNVWNRTVDLTLSNNNLFYVDNWNDANESDKSNGYWKNFTPNYSVTFDANGHGTAPADQCIAEGGKVTTPTAPTATGYTFGGWYKEAGCTNAWDFAADVVTADITLYAKWTAKTITITWNANGGTVSPATATYTYDGAAVELPTPTRTGYTFNGWFTAASGGTKITEVGTTNKPAINVTYYAQWTPKQITITWNPNGGSVDPTKSTYTYNGTPVELPTPIRANYIFNGWFTATSGGTQIADVGTTNKPTDDVTYYAQWTEKATPTFAWSADSYTAALEADNTFPTLDNPEGLSVTYTSSDPTVATIDANGNITLVTTGTTTITAIGAESATHKSATDSYTLKVVAANCKWIETDISNIESGDEVVVTMSKIGSEGDIVYYALNSSNGTTTYPKADQVTVENKTITSNVFNAIIWNISGNATDGYVLYPNGSTTTWLYCTKSNNTVKVGAGTDKVFTIQNGYLYHNNTTEIWAGYVGVSFNTTPYSWRHYPNTTGVIEGQTLKFYKKVCLDPTQYWVTWDANGGQWTDGSTKKLESYEVGATITAPTEKPTREGYRFDGWTPNPGTMLAQNTTFTAQWKEVYTITFFNNGSEFGTPIEVVTGGTVTLPATDPTSCDANYPHFFGWTETPIDGVSNTQPTDLIQENFTPTQSMNLHAVFVDELPQLGGWELVTSTEGLIEGDIYTISSTNSTSSGYVFGQQKENNRAAVSWTTGTPVELTLGGSIDEWTLYDAAYDNGAGGYLYAASSSKNYLRTMLEITDNAKWHISFSNQKVTITAQGSYTRNTIRYNSSDANNLLFSCYDQDAGNVYLFKRALGSNPNGYITSCCTPWAAPTLSANTSIAVGGTTTITYSGTTYGDVTYTSSNTDVATVDTNNGKVTGKKPGKTTITASWDGVDGSGNYCPAEATIDVTVTGSFTITYDANHANATGSTAATTIAYPTGQGTVATNGFALAGHEFVKWNTAADGTGTSYKAGDAITLTDNITLYAIWQPNQYDITVNVVGGSVKLGSTTITTQQTIADVVAHGQSFSFTNPTPDVAYTTNYTVTLNSGTADVTSNSLTVSNVQSDLNITITFTAKPTYTVTYVVPAEDGRTVAPTSIYEGGSVTMPSITGEINSDYSCEELIGWTTQATYENANGQKPNPFYAIGSNLSNIIQNTTLYAVYSRSGEGASGTVELTCTDVSTWKSDVLSGSNNAYGTVTTRTAADGSVWKTNGQIQNAGGIDLKENYYIQIPTLPGPATSITMKVSQGNIGSGEDACTDNVASATSRAFHFRSAADGSNLFTSETTSSRSRTINITEGNYTSGYIINGEGTSHIHSVTVAYGSPNIISTSLNCSNDIDEFTITYNLNLSSVVSGTQITGVCESGVTYKFSEITEYTICSAPRANGYQLVGWNTQANGKGGLTYTPGQVITSVPLSTLTLYAQWAPVVSLSDVGNISTVNATTVGGSVTLPDGERGCDPYEFIGWTEVYPSWNETAQLPALVANPYTPTVPITLYAVYTQRTTAGAFTANSAGGVYEIWVNNSAKDHMAGQINGSYNLYTTKYWDDNYDEANKAPFTITKIGENTYTIQNTDGHYITKHYYDNKLDIEDEWDNLDRYKWTVSTGTNGSWRFTNKAATTYALIYYNNFFRLYSASSVTNGSTSHYDLELTPVESAVYYSAPSCGDYAIHFYTHGGEFVQGYYAYPTAVKEGLNGTVETKFPSATLNGYTFVGWKENSPQDEITDNSPEGDTSATPYGLKKPGDDLITTTRREYHAVYYYYDELQDVDLSGPITTSIFAENNAGEKRFLSGTPSDNPGTLSSTTACGDVAVVNITPGTGENAGKYKININGYDIEPQSTSSPGLARGTEWWNIEETSAGSGEYKIYVQNGRNIVLNGVSFGNYAYNAQGSYNGDYHYVRFGNCREHHWASDPKRKPSIILSSSGPLTVTSTAGQTIKAANKLYVGAANYETQTKIYLSCNVEGVELIYENGTALSSDANGKYLTTTTDGMLTSTTLILTYTPAATTIEDGIETVTITANDAATLAKASRLAEVRHLPATFAIVAKVGNLWYALPSQGLNSTDALVGYPVEVDNQNDPTAVTAVPENADWSLRQVYAASHSDAQKDRFKLNGANIMFENNASPAKMLNASVSNNYLLTNAEYDNYKQSDNQGLYEWTPTTTDLETYTLTNAGRTDKKLNVSVNTVFGVHAQNVATNSLRFLPINDRYTPLALQVVEWKENSIVVMYNGDPAQTASVSVNGGVAQTTTLSAAQRDIAVYELTATGLAANPTQRLSITIGTEKLLLPIPYIVNSNTTDATLTSNNKTLAAVSDLVVLNGKTFTADAATASKYTFRNVTVYGGGSLIIPSGKGLGVNSLTMRVGAVVDDNYKNLYPSMLLAGTINTGNINIDYLTTADYYYPLSVPEEVTIGDIKYPVDIYGSNVDKANTGSFQLKYYDGAQRVAQGSQYGTGWVVVDETTTTTLTPNQGYAIWGIPKKVSVNGGAKERQKYGIHRIPISTTADKLATNEKTKAEVQIEAHGDASTPPNDRGWNYLGNPYLAQLGGMDGEDEDLQMGLLEKEKDANGDWTGGWVYNNEQVRYITVTNDCQNFEAKRVADATIPAFSTFFIQASKNGAILLTAPANPEPASIAARRYAAQQEAAKEITTGILLTGNDQTDRTGLLIADNFTEEYEFNADLSKFENSGINLYTIGKTGNLAYMAINQALAEQPIPVGYTAPAEGLYTIAFDEDRYNATDISALYLIDYDSNEKTNLLHTDYSFVTAAGTNNQRFALQVAFAPENATNVEWVGDATVQVGVEGNTLMLNNLPNDAAVHVFDALGRLMYHAPTVPTEMQLTLPTGYYLVRIADKQNAVVIKTVIP